jgi:prefoldin subunit 5
VDSIQILSHGAEGKLYLGDTILTSENLDYYSNELTAIGSVLSSEGDILLYGCAVASGTVGQSFIENLARHTGADVAASTDNTGALVLGGNWMLEAATGVIESDTLVIDSYPGLLNHIPGGPGTQLTNFENNLGTLDANVESLQGRVGQVKEIIESVETILNIPENIQKLCDLIGKFADSGALMAKALEQTATLRVIAKTFETALKDISKAVGTVEHKAEAIDNSLEPYKTAVAEAKDYIENTIDPALELTRNKLGQAIQTVADARNADTNKL